MRATFTRRTLFAAAAASLTAAELDPAYKLIAHRGGVVDETHPENSPGSLEAAIARGYWMIEVDIRRTKDGEPILQHDANFKRFYGDERPVEQMTWAEVSRLRSNPGGTKPIHFREACAMCEGKVRLMLDLKSADWPEAFYNNLASVMQRHKLLATAYMLGGGTRPATFLGPKCFQSANTARLRAAIDRGEDVKSRYYLFEQASELSPETFALCGRYGVIPVASINTFRYTMAKRDEWQGPVEDAARMKALGVRHFQIDSRYDSLFSRK